MRILPRFTKDDVLNFGVALAYSTVLAVLLSRHVFWRDEVQAWLIARDSVGIFDLIHNLRFEGHPPLWYLLLMVPAHLGAGINVLLVIQAALAIGTISIVLWRAPFTRMERLIFPFGAIPLIEHGALARSYMLGFLLMMLTCTVWSRRYERPLVTATLIALLANVHILFAICAIAFVLAYAAGRMPQWQPPSRKEICAGAIVFIGLSVAIVIAQPNEGAGYFTQWHFEMSFERFRLAMLGMGGILGQSRNFFVGAFSAAIVMVFVFLCRKDRSASVFLAVSIAGIFMFLYIKYAGGIWHHGIFFIALIAAVWMAREGASGISGSNRAALLAVLSFSLLPASGGIVRTFQHPRSHSFEVADFITRQGWDKEPVIGSPYATAVLGYLGAKEMYYLGAQRWNSFVLLDERHTAHYDLDAAIDRAVRDVGLPATMVLQHAGAAPDMQAHGFALVAVFDKPSPVTDESFVVYRREAPPAN